MPKSRRKSDVHALRNNRADALKKPAKSGSRRKTISTGLIKPNLNSDGNNTADNSIAAAAATVKYDATAKENYNNNNIDDNMTGTSHVSISSKRSQRILTPSKKNHGGHNNRGGDAGYFYKHLPTTPLHKLMTSARKKHHMTPSLASLANSQNNNTTNHKVNTSYLSNSSASSAGDFTNESSMNSSTDQAMMDLKLALDTSHVSTGTNHSTVSSQANASSGSSSAGGSSDAMNRSVLSDTTELTASNFVFTASSKQCILAVARSEKKQKRKEESEKQAAAEDSLKEVALVEKLPLQEVQIAEMMMEDDLTEQTNIAGLFQQQQTLHNNDEASLQPTTQMALEAKNDDKSKVQEENPSSQASTTQQQEALNTSLNEPRRPPLLAGPSPASTLKSKIQVSPKSLRKFTASLKRNRIQRQFERDQDIKKRLSMSSRKVPLPPSAGMRGANISRFSLGNASAGDGRQSLGSVIDQTSPMLLNAEESPGGQQWSNNSSKMAESPFSSKQEMSQLADPDSSPEVDTGADDTADIAFQYQQWMRDPLDSSTVNDSVSSVRNSESALMLRRLAQNKSSEISMDLDSSRQNNNGIDLGDLEEQDVKDMSQLEAGSINASLGQGLLAPSPFLDGDQNDNDDNVSDDSVNDIMNGLDDIFNSSPVSQRNASTAGSPAARSNTSNGDQDRVNNSDTKRKSPSTENDASPDAESTTSSSALTSPPETRNSLLIRHAPTSASKLTPSRLSKKPRRVVNPESIQSPARNTRSASKQRPDTSMEQNLPAPSPARRSIGSSKTNASPGSIDSSVVSKTSRRSSVTADLADIGGLFDFTTEFKDSVDKETQAARNQRRETANPSDFGEVMQFFEGQDSENRRSSAVAMPNGRRSSMFQTSLARLPEDSTVSEDTETLMGKSDTNNSPEPQMKEGSSIASEPPMNLASPAPARKVSSVRKANSVMIDSPARNTRSASKKKQEVAHEDEAMSPLIASDESKGDVSASLNLSGLMEGLSQLSPTSNPESASKNTLADDKSEHNGDGDTNAIQADDGSGKKGSSSRYFLDTQEDDKDNSRDESIENIGSASKRGQSRYSLNDSSSSNEGEQDDNGANDESNDVKTVDDDNTASLSDVGSVLGMLTDSNNFDDKTTSESKRQRNSLSSDGDSLDTGELSKQVDVEDTREIKRRKSLSLSREEDAGDTVSEPEHNSGKEMTEASDTAALGDIGDLLGSSDGAATVPVLETSPVQNNSSETTDENTAERPVLLSANDSHVLSSALKKPGDNKRQPVSSARKTVNFKSPEAAEYNIGSVSSNLTPMLKSQAKALFKLPSTNEESCDMSISSSDSTLSATSPAKESNEEILARDEVTVTLEMDMNQLMANLGEDATGEETAENRNPVSKDLSNNSSIESSPGGPSQLSQENATVELESNLLDLLANTSEKGAVSEERPEMGGASREAMASTQDSSYGSIASQNNQQAAEEMTVELEDNVQGLLASIAAEGATNEVQHVNAEGSFDSTHEARCDTGENDSSIEISQDMTDAKSIASANAPGTDAGLSLRDRQRLDFSSPTTNNSQTSSQNSGVEEDTIQLEVDMATLINTVGSRSEGNGFNHLDVSAIPLSSPSDQGTPSFRSEASGWSEKKQSESYGLSPGSDFDKPTNESTVQLEDNVQELLNNADALGAGTDDLEEDSVDTGHTKKESFTVELEDNMAMLLDANRTDLEQASGNVLDIDIQDTPGKNHSLRSRRSSIASHTFSLVPEGRLDASIAVKTSEADSPEMADETILVPSQDSKDKKQPQEVKLDLHYQELLDLASVSKPISNQFPDILGDFVEIPQKSATENLNSFLAEACDQLESHIDSIPDIEAEFRLSLEEDSEKFFDLQQHLRNSEGTNSVRESIGKLGVGASESNNYAMAIWSKDMLTSIQEQQLPHMLESMQGVITELEQHIKQIEDANNLLSSMEDATVRRARRKSIKRRKVCNIILRKTALSHKTYSNTFTLLSPFLFNSLSPLQSSLRTTLKIWKQRLLRPRKKSKKKNFVYRSSTRRKLLWRQRKSPRKK